MKEGRNALWIIRDGNIAQTVVDTSNLTQINGHFRMEMCMRRCSVGTKKPCSKWSKPKATDEREDELDLNKTFPVAASVLGGIRGRFQKLTVYCFQLSLDIHAHTHMHVYISMNIHSYMCISTDTPTRMCFYECTF